MPWFAAADSAVVARYRDGAPVELPPAEQRFFALGVDTFRIAAAISLWLPAANGAPTALPANCDWKKAAAFAIMASREISRRTINSNQSEKNESMNAPTNSPPTAKSIGDAAEKIAADFLSKRGLRLVESNYRCRFGEIDLVMRDGDSLVFVEVRRRENSQMARKAFRRLSVVG